MTRLILFAFALFFVCAVGPLEVLIGLTALCGLVAAIGLVWFLVAMAVFYFDDKRRIGEIERDAEKYRD